MENYFDQNLFQPIEEMRSRPKKAFRSYLVKVAYEWGLRQNEKSKRNDSALSELESILEDLHLASLIVDDIEDSSQWRRGGKSLHLLVGMPKALNAGNWLYFDSLSRTVSLPKESSSIVLQILVNGLEQAHRGQALDLGAPIWEIPQQEIPVYVYESLRLKSGVLMGMALESGAVLACPELSDSGRQGLRHLGQDLGILLQAWDDIGNYRFAIQDSDSGKVTPKDFEDMANGRPGFIWKVAAEILTEKDFEIWKSLIRKSFSQSQDFAKLVNESSLEDLRIFHQSFPLRSEAMTKAKHLDESLFSSQKETLKCPVFKNEISSIVERIIHAYV